MDITEIKKTYTANVSKVIASHILFSLIPYVLLVFQRFAKPHVPLVSFMERLQSLNLRFDFDVISSKLRGSLAHTVVPKSFAFELFILVMAKQQADLSVKVDMLETGINGSNVKNF